MLFKLFIFLSLYLPFQLAVNPVPGVDLASIRVLILAIFFLWLASGLKNKKILIGKNIQTALVLSFLFLNFISIFFARNPDWSVRKILYLFSIFPIYFVASNVLDSRKKLEKIIKGLVFSGALAAVLGIFQFSLQFFIGVDKAYRIWSKYALAPFLGDSFFEMVLAYPSWLVNISGRTIFRAISVFPDPHMFSFFLGLLLPLSFGLWLNCQKNGWLVAFFLIFLADILTFSRGGYLGLLFGALALIFIFWPKMKKKHKGAVILSGLIFLLVIIIPNPVFSRFFSSFNLREGSNSGRIAMWKKAEETIMQRPFFGTGLGNFPLEVNPLAVYREPIYAHNTYLDIASESGIPAALAWIAILFFSIREFLRKRKDNILNLSAVSSLVIFSVHSLADTGLYSPVVLTLFLIIISFSHLNESEKNI